MGAVPSEKTGLVGVDALSVRLAEVTDGVYTALRSPTLVELDPSMSEESPTESPCDRHRWIR
jgi:hypothetical protein